MYTVAVAVKDALISWKSLFSLKRGILQFLHIYVNYILIVWHAQPEELHVLNKNKKINIKTTVIMK